MCKDEFICQRCGDCCKYLEFYTKLMPAEVEFYKARCVEMHHVKDDDYVLRIPYRCPQLVMSKIEPGTYICVLHGDAKPVVCRDWPTHVEGWPSPCKHMNDGV